MIPLVKQYKSALAWFISGLVLAVLLFLGTSAQESATISNRSITTAFTQSANVFNQSATTASPQADVTATYSEFGATHLEPNFYQ